ncbi:phage Gp37/Gp68 family protein [Rubripirellula sp.]|nr:phage Gp37/Gp68 family protein [Rubripirellula sp.]
MATKTKIQWCDSTANPTMGCDGCELWNANRKSCYAGVLHQRFGGVTPGYAPSFEEVTLFPGRMAEAARWKDLSGTKRKDKPWLDGLPRHIFVSDMSDSLSKSVSFEFLKNEIIDIVTSPEGSRHNWLWLTKQPQRMAKCSDWLNGDWPENLWAGTSITSQKTTTRVGHLLKVGNERTTRFLSVEPQFDEVDLSQWLPELDWIIQGGESGHGCREFKTEWADELISQCRTNKVAFFLKQLGSFVTQNGQPLEFNDNHAGDWEEWPSKLKVRQMPKKKTAKKSSGKSKVSSTKSKPRARSCLSKICIKHLDEYQKRCNAVCDLLNHVLNNEDVTGFYLWGPRGCGKTTGISRALEKLKKTPVLFKGTATAEGLFESAKDSSDGILWFNDDPRLMKDNAAQQYLLAMLEGTVNPKTGEARRIVTKSRAKSTGSKQFEFTGKIIFDSNVPLGGTPVLQAVEDRLVVHHFAPTNSELSAVLKYLASLEERDPDDEYTMIRPSKNDWKYWERTTSKERKMIADFIVKEATDHKHPLTIRLFRDSLRYFCDQKELGFETDWKDVVVKNLTQYDVSYKHTRAPSRKERLEKQRQELQEFVEDAEEFMKTGKPMKKADVQSLWMEAFGENKRQFFRRLGECPENIRAIYDSLPDDRTA